MKVYSNITNQIKAEVNNYIWKKTEIAPKVWFSAYNTIKRALQYYLSYFESGSYDDEGFKKYFHNIVRNPCLLMQKMINFDTKDIRFLSTTGGKEIETWLMERDLKFWLRDTNFGKVLKGIFESIPHFGSAVIKDVGDRLVNVPIKNLYVEPTADDIRSANYVIEVHPYTLPEFLKEAQKMGWDNIEKVEETFLKSDAKYITVYERYGWLNGKDNGLSKDDKYVYARAFSADAGQTQQERERGERMTDILLNVEETECPYWDFHAEKVPGRWLGLGQIELLTDPQIRVNEIFNLQVKASYWAALGIFQSRDSGINRNLLTEVKNGEILYSEQPIDRVDTQNRNLSGFEMEKNDWLRNRDEQTMSSPLLQGGQLPSRTPAVVAQMLISQAGSYFAYIQEKVAMRLKDVLYEVVIPKFLAKNNEDHYIRLAGKDLDQYRELMIEQDINQEVWGWIMKNGSIPLEEERVLLEGIVKEKWNKLKEKHILIPKGLYNDISYKIEIDIVGEGRDTRVESSNLQMLLQLLVQDPTILTDPTKRRIMTKFLENNGMSIEDIAPQSSSGDLASTIQEVMGKNLGGGNTRMPNVNTPNLPQTNKTL